MIELLTFLVVVALLDFLIYDDMSMIVTFIKWFAQ